MTLGYQTVHVSSCDGLSKGFKCRYISLVNAAGRMSSRDARVRGYITTLKPPRRRFALLNISSLRHRTFAFWLKLTGRTDEAKEP
jgi:hypothetical protein